MQGVHVRHYWHPDLQEPFLQASNSSQQQQQQQQQGPNPEQQQQQQQTGFSEDRVRQFLEHALQQQAKQFEKQKEELLQSVRDMLPANNTAAPAPQPGTSSAAAAAVAAATGSGAAAAAATAVGAAEASACLNFQADAMECMQPFINGNPRLADAVGPRTHAHFAGQQGNGTAALVQYIGAACMAGAKQACAEMLGAAPATSAAAAAAAAAGASKGAAVGEAAAAAAATGATRTSKGAAARKPPRQVPQLKSWGSLVHLAQWYCQVSLLSALQRPCL